MKVNRQALIGSLEKAAMALGGTDAPMDQKCFSFLSDLVQATNGTILITTKLPEDLKLMCKVPGDSLLSLLKTITGEQVELSVKGTDLRVTTTKIVGKFQTVPLKSGDFKVVDTKNPVASIGAQIMAGLNLCRHNTMKTGTGPMCGVRIEGSTILSTNKFSISKFCHPEGDAAHCTVPVEFIDAVAKFESVDGVVFTGEALVAHIGPDVTHETTLASTVIGGDYPNVAQYFPEDDAPSCLVELAEPLDGTINRCVAFLKDVENVDKDIAITCEGDTLTVRAKSPAVGEFEETVSLTAAIDGKIEFLINPLLLKKIPGNSFRFFTKERLVLFTDKEINYSYLVQTRE